MTNAPAIPKSVVRMKPWGSCLSPGVKNLAKTPAIKPIKIVQRIHMSIALHTKPKPTPLSHLYFTIRNSGIQQMVAPKWRRRGASRRGEIPGLKPDQVALDKAGVEFHQRRAARL